MRKLSLFLSALLFAALLPVSASGSATPDEHWVSPLPTANGQIGVSFDDREDYFSIGSLRALVINNQVNSGPLCKSLTDSSCSGALYFAIKAILSPCSSATEVNCVEGISARKADGTTEVAEFISYVTSETSAHWQGDASKDIPDSKVESLWRFPTIDHAGGRDFLLNPILDGTYKPGNKPKWRRLVAMIQPVSKVADPQAERPVAMGNDRLDFVTPSFIEGGGSWTGAQRGGLFKNCATTVTGYCFKREPFPDGISFSLSVRTSAQVSGWVHGRMKSPEVSITQRGNAWVTTVGGMPTEVPVVTKWLEKSEFVGDVKGAYKGAAVGGVSVGDSIFAERYGSTGQYDSVIISRLNAVRPLIKDTATANPKIWSFGGIDPLKLASDVAVLGGKGSCVLEKNGLTGLVMTNATTYDGSIPAFNQKDQTLNYLVSAPHYSANGSEFLGTYDLVIRADVARCIYGFNKSPTSATVSIVRGESVEKVSTITLSEKDGWLSLAAYGFTFSSPKISVKLNRAADEVSDKAQSDSPTTSGNSTTSKSVAVKPAPKKMATKTIYCANANSRKMVKGTNPKCPKGYKLVR